MHSRRSRLFAALTVCAPLPALIVGIITMREIGVGAQAWAVNIAAAALGLLIWSLARRLPPLIRRVPLAAFAVISMATIVLPFASEGMLGVHRWVSVAGMRLHASAIVAPLIILCIAGAASRDIRSALAIAVISAAILAGQPDAAHAPALAAASAVILVCAQPNQPRKLLLNVILLFAVSACSFIRPDPLPPVAHVEGIFDVASSKGLRLAAVAMAALLVLPLPFFAACHRHRRPTALALGVYVAMTLLAPTWGTFPIPVMGSGASPILGYFIALAVGLGGPSQFKEAATGVRRPKRETDTYYGHSGYPNAQE